MNLNQHLAIENKKINRTSSKTYKFKKYKILKYALKIDIKNIINKNNKILHEYQQNN